MKSGTGLGKGGRLNEGCTWIRKILYQTEPGTLFEYVGRQQKIKQTADFCGYDKSGTVWWTVICK